MIPFIDDAKTEIIKKIAEIKSGVGDTVSTLSNAFNTWKTDWTKERAQKLDNLDMSVNAARGQVLESFQQAGEVLGSGLQSIETGVQNIQTEVQEIKGHTSFIPNINEIVNAVNDALVPKTGNSVRFTLPSIYNEIKPVERFQHIDKDFMYKEVIEHEILNVKGYGRLHYFVFRLRSFNLNSKTTGHYNNDDDPCYLFNNGQENANFIDDHSSMIVEINIDDNTYRFAINTNASQILYRDGNEYRYFVGHAILSGSILNSKPNVISNLPWGYILTGPSSGSGTAYTGGGSEQKGFTSYAPQAVTFHKNFSVKIKTYYHKPSYSFGEKYGDGDILIDYYLY